MDKYDGLFTLDKFKNPINNGHDDISDIYGGREYVENNCRLFILLWMRIFKNYSISLEEV